MFSGGIEREGDIKLVNSTVFVSNFEHVFSRWDQI